MEKIGIFGGSFDPVHNEHIAVAKSALSELKLDKLIIVPAGRPPHKTERVLSGGGDRLMMAKLSFKDIPKTEVSSYETAKNGKSFSFETVEYFKNLYPKAKLFFIMGADMLVDFPTWKNPGIITGAAKLVVAGRGQTVQSEADAQKTIKVLFNADVKFLKFKGGNISSTKVRMLEMFGRDVSAYVPAAVDEYISENNLYPPDSAIAFALKYLTPKRARHSALVAACALEKAKQLKLGADKIIAAAALHDVAKNLQPEDIPGFVAPQDIPKPVVHQFAGAYMAEKIYGLDDAEIIDAIKYHCSGKAEMTDLGKLLYVSDMIEDDRDFPGADKLRALFKTDFEECFRRCLKSSYLHLKKTAKKSEIYAETLNAYNYYRQ